MSKVRIRRNQYSKAFKPILLSDHRYLVCFGGRGSGKTNHIILKLLALTFLEEHINIVYARHEKTTLRDTTFKDICNYINNSPFKGLFSFSTSHNSSMIFTNTITGKQMLPFGLSDEENTKGISEATHVWIDEVDKCTIEQVMMINSVIRTPKSNRKQLIVSYNPVSDKNWLREFFFDETDGYKANSRFGDDILIHHSTVYDNEYINVEEYVRNLQLMYGYSQNLLNINLKGLWGIQENKNPFFFAWDDSKFLGKVQFNQRLPLILSFDFNINPATCSVWQFSSGTFIYCLKAYKLDDTTLEDLCNRILVDYPGALFRVTGDPAGNSRYAGARSANDTLYTIIKRVLRLSELQIDQPAINYAGENYWRETRVFCNLVLQNHPNFIFNTDTTSDLRHELHIATTEEGKDKLYKTAGPTEYGMNLVDTFMYFMLTYMTGYLK